jgi:hypothetical protein
MLYCTGLPVGLPIKENPGGRYTPRGHNLNYTIWILYADQ